MTLRHLKIYVAVCKSMGITSAAEELHMAQPSVSLAVSELENYYGIRLFDRISRKLYITEAGRQLNQYALHIVSLFDEMEVGIRNCDNVGMIRVGSSITIGSHILPPCIQIFKERYPLLQVKVTINNSSMMTERVLSNEIDFALIEGKVVSPYITREEFLDYNLVFVCSNDHPLAKEKNVSLDRLLQEDFLLREKGSAGREYFDSVMKLHDVTVEPIWESISTHAIINAVKNNFGISLLPELLVKDYIENGSLQAIKTENLSLKRKFSIIYHKNKFLSASAQEFIHICREYGLY